MNAQLKAVSPVEQGLLELALRRPARVVGFATPTGPADEELMLRLAELGFLDGERVEVLARAAFGGPLAVRIGTATFALRRSEAAVIRVCADA